MKEKDIQGNNGKCIIQDCLDGMKIFSDNYFGLAFADPPYNIKFQGFAGSPSKSDSIKTYDDSRTPQEYREWCKTWFKELKRISERQIVSPGLKNLSMWYKDQEVTDIFGIFDKTGSFGSRIATFATFQPLLFFGQFSQGLLTNSMQIVHVFRSNNIHEWIHPTPRPFEVLESIFSRLRVKSVIDPFLGSGTTAQVCETLGIKWHGFEINKTYIPDIERRIKIGIDKYKRHFKQTSLLQFK